MQSSCTESSILVQIRKAITGISSMHLRLQVKHPKINLVLPNLSEETLKNIFDFLLFLNTEMTQVVKIFPDGREDLFTLHSQYHVCWF